MQSGVLVADHAAGLTSCVLLLCCYGAMHAKQCSGPTWRLVQCLHCVLLLVFLSLAVFGVLSCSNHSIITLQVCCVLLVHVLFSWILVEPSICSR